MTQANKKETPLTLDVFTAGIWKENPVFVMMLGLCPVLAVTNSVLNSLAMGIAEYFCTGLLKCLSFCIHATLSPSRYASRLILLSSPPL